MSLYNWGYLCLMLSLLLTIFSLTIVGGEWAIVLGFISVTFVITSGGLFGLAGGRDPSK
jgi:hypothetical protein